MTWFTIIAGTIQSFATLGALHYAWKTVDAANEAESERRRYRLAERLEDVVDLLAEIRSSTPQLQPREVVTRTTPTAPADCFDDTAAVSNA